MRTLAQRPLLTACEVTATYADAVLLGLHRGEWHALEERVACPPGADPPEHELRSAIERFRRERRLLAAEDLRAWLEERGLSGDELIACLRRALAVPGEPGAPDPAALRAEAFVSGALARCAEALAERLVALDAIGAPEVDATRVGALVTVASVGPDRGLCDLPDLPVRARRVLECDAALQAFYARTATDERLLRRLRERRLELTRVRFDELLLAGEDAAREAAMCVRVDGLAPAQVAERAGAAFRVRESELGDLDGTLRSPLAGRRPGDVVGPLCDGEGWRVAVVRDRRAPSLKEPRTRERLAAEVGARRLARQAAGRVEWHGPV